MKDLHYTHCIFANKALIAMQYSKETADIVRKHFPSLPQGQLEKLAQLPSLYKYWNEKINLISRKDIDNIAVRHILHSLFIAKVLSFDTESTILDVGTGGGFPGLPLALLFPEAQFTLLDSRNKKLFVIEEIQKSLEIKNIKTIHSRMEDHQGQYDYIISRAVSTIPALLEKLSTIKTKNNKSPVLAYLKGGDVEREVENLDRPNSIYIISDYFDEDYFQTKKLLILR